MKGRCSQAPPFCALYEGVFIAKVLIDSYICKFKM